MEATERDERGKREEIEKGKEEQGGRARSCVLGARAPWTERESLSSWLLPEDDGILVGCVGCRREKCSRRVMVALVDGIGWIRSGGDPEREWQWR